VLRTILVTALLTAAVTTATGCGQDNPSATRLTPASVAPSLAVPAGKPMLVLKGAVVGQGGGGQVTADLAGIDALTQHEMTVLEPFLKKRVTFSGVLVSDLLVAAGAGTAATRLEVHAVDDYVMSLTITDLVAQGALLATRSGGREMAVKNGGPSRLVFPDGSRLGKNVDLWVWSVDVMTVQ
jgi:hypothetical protein